MSMPQGPTHKKALVKAEAERRKNEALGNMRWAAENASVRCPPVAESTVSVPDWFVRQYGIETGTTTSFFKHAIAV